MHQFLLPGDAAPWFRGALVDSNPSFVFDVMGGRPVVMLFMGSAQYPGVVEAMRHIADNRRLFDDIQASFFGIVIDPADAEQGRVKPYKPGIRYFVDADRSISRAYRAVEERDGQERYFPHWVLLDSTLRVVDTAPLEAGDRIIAALKALIDEPEPQAPVLTVPRVFEPELCRLLIKNYEANGGTDSGFMREENGITVARIDHSHKRRSDWLIKDEKLQAALGARLTRFLLPVVQRAFQFTATRVERYVVSCYDGETGGHFRAHRDNTTAGTAHRRFACTINLNPGEYDGGDLRFPEFGKRTYRAPLGGAVIFSCSLLHEATPVTRGRRYAFLPFLYDESGAALRESNKHLLDPERRNFMDAPADAAT